MFSKGSRAYHSTTWESSCFLAKSLKCFIFLEFWVNAFSNRPCKSRAKFKLNLIRRDIEVVITGLTRNQFALTRTRVRIPLSPPHWAQNLRFWALFLSILLDFRHSFPTFKKIASCNFSLFFRKVIGTCKAVQKCLIFGDVEVREGTQTNWVGIILSATT